MITHYFTLLALRAEFDECLSGAVIREAFTQVKNELVLTLESTGGVKSLVVSLVPQMNAVYYRQGPMRAKKNSAALFPGIEGSGIGGFSLDDFSRVITVGTGDHDLKIHLFNSAASNVFFVGRGGIVRDAFKGGREFAGRPYSEVLGPPRPAPVSGPDDFLRRIPGDPAATIRAVLKNIFPHLAPLYLKELLFRAGLDGDATVGGISAAGAAVIVSIARDFEAEARRGIAMLYAGRPEEAEILSVVTLSHLLDAVVTPCGDVNAAVMELSHRRSREEKVERERSQLAGLMEREVRKTGRSLRETETLAGGESMEDLYRKTGELILTHLHELRKGQTEAELPDPSAGGAPIRIALDRSLTPAANADRYFEKARNARRSKEEARLRIGELRSRLAKYEEIVSELGDCVDLRSLKEMKMKLKSDREVPVDVRGEERLPFRIFSIGEQFEAWVGKSSAGNDLLTGKYAGPHDYWFHVRGASGSHVVLKRRSGKKEPFPKEALLAAARIAAYYSKMRKGGMVPVACCERKYVKKPKHAPPGTVVLQREEILFVEPSLP